MDTEPVDFEEYYDLVLVSDVELSPSGDRAAFVTEEFDEVDDERRLAVYTVPTDGQHEPHRLTRTSSAEVPKWGPDGRRLAVLTDRSKDLTMQGESSKDGEEPADSGQQVWLFDLERGGDPRQVTDFDEGVQEYDWRPDGTGIVVVARDPTSEQRATLERRRNDNAPIETERLQHKFDGMGWLDNVRSYLFEVEIETRDTSRLDGCHGGPFEPTSEMCPSWSPDGERIAFFANRTEDPDDSSALDVYFAEPQTGTVTAVTESDVTAVRGAWSPEGSRYAFVANNPENWYEPARLYIVDIDEMPTRPRCVSEELDRTFAKGAPIEWVDEQTIIGAVADQGRTRLVEFDANGTPPKRIFNDQRSDQTVTAMDIAGDTISIVLSCPDESPDVFATDVANIDSESFLRLTETNAEQTDRWPSVACHRFSFESEDRDVEALLYAPENFEPSENQQFSLVVSIHGGPIFYDQPEFNFEYIRWVSEGHAVLRVNYRGSTSYGQEFSESIAGDYGNKEPRDIVKGIRAAIERGWANPDEIYVTGFSYGGAQTAYILSQYDIATAGAAEHGVYDRESYFGTGDSHNRMERDFGLPWENPDTYRKISSINDVDGIDVPLLLTAGGEDWRCPASQSEQLFVSVKKQGVPARLVVYPNENHDIGDPSRAIHRLRELSKWFATHR